MIEKAQGRLLYVRGMHQLSTASRNATDELVDVLSSDEVQARIVIVLSGEIGVTNDLLRRYPHLSACLPEEVCFPDFTPDQCVDVLQVALRRALVDVIELRDDCNKGRDSSGANSSSASAYDDRQAIAGLFQDLVTLPGWKNAIDIEGLANDASKTHVRSTGSSSGTTPLQTVLDIMTRWIED
jgi:hypothetical protein